jgi:capsular exopolysaccharide synthesis family protein
LTNNNNNSSNNLLEEKNFNDTADQLRKFFFTIVKHKFILLAIVVISTLVAYFYAKGMDNIYETNISVKIDKPQGSLLNDGFSNYFYEMNFMANQIAIVKGFYVREIAAGMILDSIENMPDKSKFPRLVTIRENGDTTFILKPKLISRLESFVDFDSPKGLDVVELSVSGFSPDENYLIASSYAEAYLQYNLDNSRKELIAKRKLFEKEKNTKYQELEVAEDNLENFQQQTGILSVESSTSRLLDVTSSLEDLKNTVEIDLRAVERDKKEVSDQIVKANRDIDPYITQMLTEPALNSIVGQISEIEVKRDIELANVTDPEVISRVNADYQRDLNTLIKKRDELINSYKQNIDVSTPLDRKALTSKLLDLDLSSLSLQSKLGSISRLKVGYDAELKKLPPAVIQYAKLERIRKAAENLYSVIEGKYQEALINENSRLGNAFVIEPGSYQEGPVGPNRTRIIVAGFIIGMILAFGVAFGIEYFDKTIKTPDEIEQMGVPILSWIPSFEFSSEKNGSPENDFVVAKKPNSSISEAFKALRTRIQYSKLEEDPLQTILVTSSLPSEGKTIVSVNLAGSFAQANKKVLIMDCDLRKPRVHTVFDAERFPGISDYLFNNVKLEDIIRKTPLENLEVITSGTIPPNPSELLGSLQMKKFLDTLKEMYDIIIIDSPPCISVTDSEILFNLTDGTILVAQANKTAKDAFFKTYQNLYKINKHNLLGTVLNNFRFQQTYGYYYNYYYYYHKDNTKDKAKKS